jgi:hypothetical protein
MNKMGPITTFDSSYEFIELHRTFHELSSHGSDNDDADISSAFRAGECIPWLSLIKEYRLIILSEAGSGKTSEIRNVARTLREQGKAAFFLHLEHIPRDFEDAFEVGTYETFEEWLASGEEGWLLLDSVDEARLRDPGDFELSIRKLSRRISTAKDRTHIVITGRTTAWRPQDGSCLLYRSSALAAAATSERDPQAEDDGLKACTESETRTRPNRFSRSLRSMI